MFGLKKLTKRIEVLELEIKQIKCEHKDTEFKDYLVVCSDPLWFPLKQSMSPKGQLICKDCNKVIENYWDWISYANAKIERKKEKAIKEIEANGGKVTFPKKRGRKKKGEKL